MKTKKSLIVHLSGYSHEAASKTVNYHIFEYGSDKELFNHIRQHHLSFQPEGSDMCLSQDDTIKDLIQNIKEFGGYVKIYDLSDEAEIFEIKEKSELQKAISLVKDGALDYNKLINSTKKVNGFNTINPFEKTKKMYELITLVSVLHDSTEIRSSAKYDREKKLVFGVKQSEAVYEKLDRQYIEFSSGGIRFDDEFSIQK
jgi:hypothetical protein